MTLVTQQNDSRRFDLQSTTVHGAQAECAAPDCTDTHEALTLTLGADFGGTAVDWGVVAFCSYECFLNFADLNRLREDEHPNDRPSTIIYWDDSYAVTANTGDTITRKLTCRDDLLPETIQELITGEFNVETPLTVTIHENTVKTAEDTLTDVSELESVLTDLINTHVNDVTNVTITVNHVTLNITEHP